MTPTIVFNRVTDVANSTYSHITNPNECKTRDDARKHLQRQMLNAHIEGINQCISIFAKFTTKSHILDEIVADRAELIQLMRAL